MSGLYNEADYEKSVIELLKTDLMYDYVYNLDDRDFYSLLYENILTDYLSLS